MKKDGINYSNLFSPNFMVRYAPGHMRNLSGKDVLLNYTNLYSLNKTSEIEDGLSAILGIDFKINEKRDIGEKERFSIFNVTAPRPSPKPEAPPAIFSKNGKNCASGTYSPNGTR